MTVASDRTGDLVAQLRDTWDATATVLGALEPGQWDLPTECPGWTVRDVTAHMIGTESMLAGRDAPAYPARAWSPHVKNDIGALNEAWVEARRDRRPAEVLGEWRAVTAERLDALSVMTEAEMDAPSWTPVGTSAYRRFMQIRVFDCWVHEQDIRRAVDRPGHVDGPAAEASVDEIERALGYVVGKRAKAPTGSRVTFELNGAATRRIHVAVDARAAVVDALDRAPDVTVSLHVGDFVALACGRRRADEVPVGYEGDQALGARITAHLAFTV